MGAAGPILFDGGASRRGRPADRRQSTCVGRSAPPVLGLALWGCAHTAHTVAPYRDDAHAAQELEERASSSCLQRTSQRPPRTFVTDGCSAFVNDGWVECCVEHDAAYWCGGTAEGRRQADRRLEQCVADLGHPCLARLMYPGVRVGAPAWTPLPWRWGFGWDFPYDGDPRGGSEVGVKKTQAEEVGRPAAGSLLPRPPL